MQALSNSSLAMIRGGTRLLPIVQPQVLGSGINLTQKRTSFYNKYTHGPTKISNPDINYLKWVRDFFGPEGWAWFKGEVERTIKKPFRTRIEKKYQLDELVKFEDFDSEEAIKRWKPVADSDTLNGFSVANLVRSPQGHALFTGYLDNRTPNDGLTTKSGFAGIIGPQAPRDKLYEPDTHWDWTPFNSLEIKFRGDGRKYMVVASVASYLNDLTFYDTFTYPLYTRGGPYWQIYRIPFTKMFWCNKGYIQDNQGPLPKFHIKFVAITLEDVKDGPFEIEIDYIGLLEMSVAFLEMTAYESYCFPHITYRPLQVGCDPPDQDA